METTTHFSDSTTTAVTGKTTENMVGWRESAMGAVAQTSLGQTLLKLIDRFLWVVEKSAQWSLPCQEVAAEENGKAFGKMELVRPLPWVLFLPGLVILRVIRAGLNVGAFLLGYPQIQPSSVVKFVQKGRRRLRAIKMSGAKSLRRKGYSAKDKRLSMNEAKKALITSIRLTLSTLSCLDGSKPSLSPPPTRIRVSALDLEPTPTPEEKSTTESAGSPMHSEIKRKFSQVSSDERSSDESEHETLQSKIERLALEDSTDDPDFNPADCSTTESSTTTSDGEEAEPNVSLNEIHDVRKEAMLFVKDSETLVEDLTKTATGAQVSTRQTEKRAEESATSASVPVINVAKEASPKLGAGEPNFESSGYYSPMNSGQDGEADFYSPISSKSSSPVRPVSPTVHSECDFRISETPSTSDLGNGEVVPSSAVSSIASEERTNGTVLEKHTVNARKHHQKGRRASHGNRKKK